jgi:hypothetical protein
MMGQFRNVLMMAYHTDDNETMDKVQNFVILKKASGDLNVLGQCSLKVIITGLSL